MFVKHLRTSFIVLILFTGITGLFYPMLITGIAQLVFPHQANGSLIERNGKILGSELIGQQFNSPEYFWSRISATGPTAYNGGSSSGSNYGPTNPILFQTIEKRIEALKEIDPLNTKPVPVDLVTASASGLDPHITIAAAKYQVSRIARLRNVTEQEVLSLIEQCVEPRGLGFLGEPGVNVLNLNLALDALPAKGNR